MTAAPPKTDNPFIEATSPALDHRLDELLDHNEELLLRLASDMADDAVYGERWLLLSRRRLLLVGVDGADEIAVADIRDARIETLVGGSYLEINPKEGAPLRLHYSSSQAPKFAEANEAINQLANNKELELPTAIERSRCTKCDRLLPEKDGICPACISKWSTLNRIGSYLSPYKGRAVALVLITAALTLVELVPPLITRYIVNEILTPRADVYLLLLPVLLVLGIQLLNWIGEVGHGWIAVWLAGKVVADIRSQLYRRLQFMPLRFFDKRKVGALMSRLTNDAGRLEGFLIDGIPFIFMNALMIVGILSLLLYMNWQLTLYVLIPVPPIILGGLLIWNRLTRLWNRWSAKWSRFNSHLNESISGIRVVKAFAQEDRESRRFDGRNEELRDASVTADRNVFAFFTVMNFIMSFGVFFVWYFGGIQILRDAQADAPDGFKLGDLMAFVSYIWMLYRPLKWFGELTNWMTRAFSGAERIFEIIDSKAESFEDPNAVPMPDIRGHVNFREAFFGYDRGKPILKGVDLEVEPGEMIGLVGKSGAGKSTLINLIARFYDADRGVLEIDGTDIRKIRLQDLRRQVGMVPQQSFLFNGTIAENIAYGKPKATFVDIVLAARAAHAHEFIITKPDGYDMVVGESGNKLSGGERQRLAIARAILHDPKILILDEATSSLDTPTEKKIQAAINNLIKGRTTFAIAHRLSTLRSADRLVVVDEGRIAEVGTHAELMERQGHFYKLVKTQQETSAIMAVNSESE
jgi:ATP-binding cassette, subfamily B, bacterial